MLLPLLLVALATPLPDQGVFPELNAKAQLGVPPWLAPTRPTVTVDPTRQVAVLRFDGLPVHAWRAKPGEPLPDAVAALPGLHVSQGRARRGACAATCCTMASAARRARASVQKPSVS